MDFFFFFQAEDGIRDIGVTGVQTCALPIYRSAADDDVDVLAQFRADVPNPEEEALRQLDREVLRRAISKLPEPYRVAVTLVELQGLSCEEAAAVMGTPKGTVLSRLFRARERLRRLLLSEFGRARTRVPVSAQNS